ncbi:MAG: hypothetical protein V4633_04680 [Pseudomonadota bacterium]
MLLRNDVLEYTLPHPHTVRILWVDSTGTIAYTYELNASRATPQLATMQTLVDDVREQRATLLLIDPCAADDDTAGLPPRHLALRDRAFAIVSALCEHEPAIYQPRARGQLVTRLSELHGVSYPSVYRYLRRFWERGQTINALLPDYGNSGAPGKTRRANADIKRGRPRKSGAHPGLNADPAIRGTFRTAVARYAATHAAFSRRGAYRQMIEDFFKARDAEALQTFGQFNYWIEKDACIRSHAAARQKHPVN